MSGRHHCTSELQHPGSTRHLGLHCYIRPRLSFKASAAVNTFLGCVHHISSMLSNCKLYTKSYARVHSHGQSLYFSFCSIKQAGCINRSLLRGPAFARTCSGRLLQVVVMSIVAGLLVPSPAMTQQQLVNRLHDILSAPNHGCGLCYI